jgi:hypothetical protein
VRLGALNADVADGVGSVNVERAESLSRREIRSTHCELEFVSEGSRGYSYNLAGGQRRCVSTGRVRLPGKTIWAQ